MSHAAMMAAPPNGPGAIVDNLHVNLQALTPQSAVITVLEVVIVALFAIGFNWLVNKFTPFNDKQEIEHNLAYAIQRGCIGAAQVIGMLSSINLSSPSQWSDLLWLAMSGLLISLVLLALYPVAAHAIVGNPLTMSRSDAEAHDWASGRYHESYSKVKILNQLRWQNPASASVIGAVFIAASFGVNGSFTGTSPGFWTGVILVVVFSGLSLALPFLLVLIYGRRQKRSFRYNLLQGIRDGKWAPAIDIIGFLIAQGVVMRTSVSGDFNDTYGLAAGYFMAVISFIVSVALVMFVGYLVGVAVDKAVMPRYTMGDIYRQDKYVLALVIAVIRVVAVIVVSLALSSFALFVS